MSALAVLSQCSREREPQEGVWHECACQPACLERPVCSALVGSRWVQVAMRNAQRRPGRLAASVLSSPALPSTAAAAENGYRTKHYQLTHGSLGCYMSHLQLYQHILRSGNTAAVGAPSAVAVAVDVAPSLAGAACRIALRSASRCPFGSPAGRCTKPLPSAAAAAALSILMLQVPSTHSFSRTTRCCSATCLQHWLRPSPSQVRCEHDALSFAGVGRCFVPGGGAGASPVVLWWRHTARWGRSAAGAHCALRLLPHHAVSLALSI